MDAGDLSSAQGAVVPGYFTGQFYHSLDPKKRLTIPSDWRDHVGSPPTLYVLPGLNEKCLYVFPGRLMAERLEAIREKSITDTRARLFSRMLGMNSSMVSWDGQGRIRIPDGLLDSAGLVDQVMMIGALRRFEVWSPDVWKSSAPPDTTLGDVAAYVGF